MKIYIAYQVILVVIGILACTLSIVLLKKSPIEILEPCDLLIRVLGVGASLILLAILGIVSCMNMQRPGIFVFYGLLTTGLLGVTIWGTIMQIAALKAAAMDNRLESIWMSTSNKAAIQIQVWGQCCGLKDAADRVQPPCTLYDPAVGCLDLMRSHVQKRLTTILVVTAVVLLAQTVALALSLVMFGASLARTAAIARPKKSNDTTPLVKVLDGQPFNGWHQAVFL